MRTDIVMPKAGLTMIEGTISQWKAAEGALVQKGEVIMEYENEKNTIEYETVHGGYLHILAAEGDTVAVGEPIAVVTDTKEEYDALTGGAPSAPVPEAAPAVPAAPAAAPAQKTLWVRLPSRQDARMRRIELVLTMFPGVEPMVVYFEDTKRRLGARCIIHPALVQELQELLGPENVVVK